MMIDFHCPEAARSPVNGPLVFRWDCTTGELSGLHAPYIRAVAQPGALVMGHPHPRSIALGPRPLTSLRDMAAIVGAYWQLPAELEPFYPLETEPFDPFVRDERGNKVGELIN